jgi:siroheme synthase (precorrin-2 oxidase/ferrochelatase)
MFVVAAAISMVFAAHSVLAQAKKPELPYVTIDHPQFTAASQATFLSPDDILIGVTDGKTAKAYPAAILAQHGVVQDQMADGPIAVTW